MTGIIIFSAGGGCDALQGYIQERVIHSDSLNIRGPVDFSYEMPAQTWALRLHPVLLTTPLRADESISTFSVLVNGDYVSGRGFDITRMPWGHDIADERVFAATVSPRKDGFLHLALLGRMWASPTVDAIEILPGLRHAQLSDAADHAINAADGSQGPTLAPGRILHTVDCPLQTRRCWIHRPRPLFSRAIWAFSTTRCRSIRGTEYTVVPNFAEYIRLRSGTGSRQPDFQGHGNGETATGQLRHPLRRPQPFTRLPRSSII